MRIKIKLVIGITLVFIFLGLGYIIVNTTIRYQQEFGSISYIYTKKEVNSEEKFALY
ncbi:hypothetical protein LZ906_011490 [Paraclostridium ghonii]|uniref:hypothetical protein n=1 Tax=Paraclostridium ghonii TaxID=29358 RepID=UPI00202CE887|nr:hypothetical protein [Paeniclostridium ghonii]MCM0167935.1 hypothetical protein [Paeniclostridium ghonii]